MCCPGGPVWREGWPTWGRRGPSPGRGNCPRGPAAWTGEWLKGINNNRWHTGNSKYWLLLAGGLVQRESMSAGWEDQEVLRWKKWTICALRALIYCREMRTTGGIARHAPLQEVRGTGSVHMWTGHPGLPGGGRYWGGAGGTCSDSLRMDRSSIFQQTMKQRLPMGSEDTGSKVCVRKKSWKESPERMERWIKQEIINW